MRVLVCGGRAYKDTLKVFEVLDALSPTEICQGGALGADFIAKSWALIRCVPCTEYKAEWSKYGRAAGPMRNELMIDSFKPDLVVAFKGGNGTRSMLGLARKRGVEVVEPCKGASNENP